MQPWQIKALKLEVSVLDAANGFVRENALYFLVAIICLMVVLLAWVLGGGLRRRFPQQGGRVRPVIVINPQTPPSPDPDDCLRSSTCLTKSSTTHCSPAIF